MRYPLIVGKESRSIADRYEDLTVNEFYQLQKWARYGNDEMTLLYSIVTQTSPEFIRKLKYKKISTLLDPFLNYLTKKWDMSHLGTPPILVIDGQSLVTPTNLDMISFGQYLSLDTYLSKLESAGENMAEDLERMQSVILITFWKDLYPDIPFTMENLDAKRDVVMDCNYADCWGVEIFFWNNISRRRKKDKGGFHEMLTLIRFKLARKFSQASVSSQQSTH